MVIVTTTFLLIKFLNMYTEQLTIKLSKKDREIAKENSNKIGLPVSTYLRFLIVKQLGEVS